MSAPKRIQMSRQRRWRAEHPDAVIVARPSKWGNPFRAGKRTTIKATDGQQTLTATVRARDVEAAVGLYRQYLTDGIFAVFGRLQAEVAGDLHELAGKDLACWCPLDQPCHADVLLDLANPVHDYDPVHDGCRCCGALPFDGVPCEPPVQTVLHQEGTDHD